MGSQQLTSKSTTPTSRFINLQNEIRYRTSCSYIPCWSSCWTHGRVWRRTVGWWDTCWPSYWWQALSARPVLQGLLGRVFSQLSIPLLLWKLTTQEPVIGVTINGVLEGVIEKIFSNVCSFLEYLRKVYSIIHLLMLQHVVKVSDSIFFKI